MLAKTHPYEFILYISAIRKLTAFVRHSASFLFYFPQNAIYFITLSLSVQVKCFS